MSDRELLEMAAKAAGYPVERPCDEAGVFVMRGSSDRSGHIWNPLNDDGDALRLAVKCGINVFVYPDEISAAPSSTGTVEKVKCCQFEAARRAIVRAAAEIGRSTP